MGLVGGFRSILARWKRNWLQVRRYGEAAALAPGARRGTLIGIPDRIGPGVFARSIGMVRCEEVSVQVLVDEQGLAVRIAAFRHLENVSGSFIQSRKPHKSRWVLINLLGVGAVFHCQRSSPGLIEDVPFGAGTGIDAGRHDDGSDGVKPPALGPAADIQRYWRS